MANRASDKHIKEKLLKSIGFRIKVARTEANLTQAELAALMSMTRGNIANLEAGKNNIGIATLDRLLRHCDTNLKTFMEAVQA